MKKLMFAAAVACAAAYLNAATVSWTVDYAYDEAGNELGSDYYGYFITSSGTFINDGDASKYILPIADAMTALGNKNASFVFDYALADGSGNQGFSFNGGEAIGMGVGQTSDKTGIFANNSTVSGYLVILDADNLTDATKAALIPVDEYGNAVTTSINGSGGSNPLAFGDLETMMTDEGFSWYAVGGDVPEPTSGLLLLIGMAGLALRRRRA